MANLPEEIQRVLDHKLTRHQSGAIIGQAGFTTKQEADKCDT